jgi:transcriptional regulator with XRE-family HTH domain
MKLTNDTSDKALLKELGSRIARYRLNRNLTQEALANEAGVSHRTLVRVEHGQSTQATNLFRILRALRILENIETLIPEPAVSPIQQFQLHGKKRKRASPRPDTGGKQKPWSWGDEE